MKENENAFIPTREEWEGYYRNWCDSLAHSPRLSGSEDERKEAVHEAFLKVLGLSKNLHLDNPLTPRTEESWYGFMRNQAWGRLSAYHQRQRRFEPIHGEEPPDKPSQDDTDNERDKQGYGQTTFTPCADADRAWLNGKMRQTLEIVRRKAHIDPDKWHAFLDYTLGGKSADEVVARFKTIGSTNNLYQIKYRIMECLHKNRAQFAPIWDELYNGPCANATN